jgi:hypothetical protein
MNKYLFKITVVGTSLNWVVTFTVKSKRMAQTDNEYFSPRG